MPDFVGSHNVTIGDREELCTRAAHQDAHVYASPGAPVSRTTKWCLGATYEVGNVEPLAGTKVEGVR
jgi:hypothetical protein